MRPRDNLQTNTILASNGVLLDSTYLNSSLLYKDLSFLLSKVCDPALAQINDNNAGITDCTMCNVYMTIHTMSPRLHYINKEGE